MDHGALRFGRFLCAIAVLSCTSLEVRGQWEQPAYQAQSSVAADSEARIDQLERIVDDLQREVQYLRSEAINPHLSYMSGVESSPISYREAGAPVPGGAGDVVSHYLTYDEGWAIRAHDPVAFPFELKLNFHNQFRHTGFARSVSSFTDSAGNVVPIKNRNDFDVNRGRLVFSGHAFDPSLSFYTNIDYNTVAQNPVLLLLSWVSIHCSDALTVSMGLGKVPGTWEWLESSRFTLGAERTMATTFFRPSITAGIWAQGEPCEGIFYHFLIGDGFNSFTLRAAELDTNLVYSGSVWWEPLGPFGIGFSDLEGHDALAIRFGNAFTFARNDSEPTGEPGPEQTLTRLSDGTRLVEPGALATGVTVNQFDTSLYAVHLGFKYRGASVAAEYFLRWLTSLEGTGPLPVNSLFDHGFFVQGGFFITPQLECYGIGSQVTGDHGTGSEVAAGLNWYIRDQRGSRVTLDVARIEDSPAQQDRTGYVVGSSGTLFRVQLWTFF